MEVSYNLEVRCHVGEQKKNMGLDRISNIKKVNRNQPYVGLFGMLLESFTRPITF